MNPAPRVSILVLLLLAAAAPGAAQIGVSPPRFEIPVDGRMSTHALRVLNLGKRPTEVSLSVANWDLDEENEVRILPPTEQSLDQWLVVNPLRFSIPPGRSQTVRFAIRPKVEPLPGEHRAMLYLEEIPADDGSEAASLRTRYRLGIAVYGLVGEVSRTGRLRGVEVDDRRLLLDVESLGSAHVRLDGRFAVWERTAEAPPLAELRTPADEEQSVPPAGALLAGPLPRTPVLPSTRRSLSIELPPSLAEGSYVLAVVGRLGEESFEHVLPFTLAAPVSEPELAATETD